jgi:hypothetical protein
MIDHDEQALAAFVAAEPHDVSDRERRQPWPRSSQLRRRPPWPAQLLGKLRERSLAPPACGGIGLRESPRVAAGVDDREGAVTNLGD